jgi:hypothetical protein
MGSIHGISGEEYDYLKLMTKNETLDSSIKEFKEYKQKGFTSPSSYIEAKKLGISDLAAYEKFLKDEISRKFEEKKAADAAKAELAKAEELAKREAEAQKRGFANADEMWKSDMRDLCTRYMRRVYQCQNSTLDIMISNGLMDTDGCVKKKYKGDFPTSEPDAYLAWSRNEKNCKNISPASIGLSKDDLLMKP